MERKEILLILILMTFNQFQTKAQQIINVENRKITTLDGKWHYIVDPYEAGYYDYRYVAYDSDKDLDQSQGAYFNDAVPKSKTDRVEYSFDKSGTLLVPRDWNSQDEKLFYYEGNLWYRRKFDYKKETSGNRLFLYFGAVNYKAEVYLNGKKLGMHVGGFTPFDFDISEVVKDSNNVLVLKVDNTRSLTAVPMANTDWWNYGGITRDVSLIEVPSTFIADYKVQLKKGEMNVIQGYVQLNGKNLEQTISLEIPELKLKKELRTNNTGKVNFEFAVKGLSYWSPDNPKLYQVILSHNNEKVSDQIGFRTIETKGTDILLNGKSIFLKGICIHEENGIRGGRAYSVEDARMLLGWAKELNCNFVRLAHYPHNENMLRIADQMGILVWEEIPVYWTIAWDNPKTLANAKNQLSEVITRDKNRAASIIWSMANETPKGEARNKFLIELASYARSMDDTRLISAAMEKHTSPNDPYLQIVEDDFADYVDIVAFNEYVGWYDGLHDKCKDVKFDIKYNKPVVISEFGAGALQGYHGDKYTIWTEEYQEELYRETLKMLDKIPQFSGVTPWILADFRSPKRVLPNIQDGFNRKGLISETGNRKKAFYVLQEYYKNKK